MTDIQRVMINGRWPLNLPKHRAERDSWPYWEATRLAAMHHYIRPEDVVYDIGAEAGDFSALFVTWGAQVVLIEPNPDVWPTIKAVFKANALRPLISVPVMMGDVDKDGLRWSAGWPGAALLPMRPDHGFHHLGEHTDDPTSTLDALVESLSENHGGGLGPDVLTMDVEGAEMFVVRGAGRTLQERKPAVFMSVHPQFMLDLYNQDVSLIHQRMKRLGYHGRFLCEDHEQHWVWTHPDSGRMFPGVAEDYYIPGDRIIL